MKIAIQMYTLREHCKTAEDLLATLQEVKKMGYDGVEFAGYAGVDAAKLKSTLHELGLTVVACHEGMNRLEKDIDEIVEFNHQIGNKNIVCAGGPTVSKTDMEHLRQVLETASQKAAKYNMHVLYHNHSHEFVPLADMENKLPLTIIKEYCPLELDTYWVFNSRVDVYGYMKENADKIGLVHLKDGNMEGVPCAIGEGSNHIQSILDAAKEIGAEWIIVENDDPTPDGISDANRSMVNLKTKYTL